MKTIMISMNPESLIQIVHNKKYYDVRKFYPNIKPPFRVLI